MPSQQMKADPLFFAKFFISQKSIREENFPFFTELTPLSHKETFLAQKKCKEIFLNSATSQLVVISLSHSL
jgi:hypothetical protein